MSTQNKVAFITGANKGLGLVTAEGLCALGIDVVIGSRDQARGQAAAESIKGRGKGSVAAVRFDVTQPADHQEVAEYFEKHHGKLDILVNNAGISIDVVDFGAPEGFNTTLTVKPEILRQTFDTNFFSVVALTQTLLPLIRKAPAGRIVNLSSILGSLTIHADPRSGIYTHKAFAYDASKTALNAFTVHLAQELSGTKIKVNSAHPGWVKTEMGGESAPIELAEGGKTSVQLATLGDDGPSGGFFHLGETLPW
jgi:NAD(P)-dependent dehydrogenase (short-subunit alcohol dehydrogenase family)